MSTAQTTGSIDELVTAEGLTNAATFDTAATFLVRDNISRYIRSLETADEKVLAEHGVAHGKIDGRKLYEKLNAVARGIVASRFKDGEVWNAIPGWDEFQAIVERLGQQGKYTHDLAVQLEGLYSGQADQYRSSRNLGRTRAAPLDGARGHTVHMADLGGVKEVFDTAISDAKDITGITRIKSQLERPYAERMAQLYATKGQAGIAEAAKKYAMAHRN